jgi:hypothetical protein
MSESSVNPQVERLSDVYPISIVGRNPWNPDHPSQDYLRLRKIGDKFHHFNVAVYGVENGNS